MIICRQKLENLKLLTIPQDQYPDYRQKFKNAVRALFPVLCFNPAGTETFFKAFEPQCDGKNCVIEDGQGRLTFCRYASENPRKIYIEYIIPSVWEARYSLVKEAILQRKQLLLVEKADRVLWMLFVRNSLPAMPIMLGLLPRLGFTLTPCVTDGSKSSVSESIDITYPPT